LQRLDRELFIDAHNDGVLGQSHVKPDDIAAISGEFGVMALASGLPPGKVDLLRPQETPDVLLSNRQRTGLHRRADLNFHA
jgi:hypothetical protein